MRSAILETPELALRGYTAHVHTRTASQVTGPIDLRQIHQNFSRAFPREAVRHKSVADVIADRCLDYSLPFKTQNVQTAPEMRDRDRIGTIVGTGDPYKLHSEPVLDDFEV